MCLIFSNDDIQVKICFSSSSFTIFHSGSIYIIITNKKNNEILLHMNMGKAISTNQYIMGDTESENKFKFSSKTFVWVPALSTDVINSKQEIVNKLNMLINSGIKEGAPLLREEKGLFINDAFLPKKYEFQIQADINSPALFFSGIIKSFLSKYNIPQLDKIDFFCTLASMLGRRRGDLWEENTDNLYKKQTDRLMEIDLNNISKDSLLSGDGRISLKDFSSSYSHLYSTSTCEEKKFYEEREFIANSVYQLFYNGMCQGKRVAKTNPDFFINFFKINVDFLKGLRFYEKGKEDTFAEKIKLLIEQAIRFKHESLREVSKDNFCFQQKEYEKKYMDNTKDNEEILQKLFEVTELENEKTPKEYELKDYNFSVKKLTKINETDTKTRINLTDDAINLEEKQESTINAKDKKCLIM